MIVSRYNQGSVTATIDGEPIDTSSLLGRGDRTLRGCTFRVSSDGRSTVSEMVSVLLIEPGDRIIDGYREAASVTLVAWMLGAVSITTDDGHTKVYQCAEGWPTVERIVREVSR